MVQRRMSWKEIQKAYPHQNVGLKDVEYVSSPDGPIKSGIVVCTEKDSDLDKMVLDTINGNLVTIYTTIDEDTTR